VLGHHPVLVSLHLERPLHPNQLVIRWEIDEALGAILLDGVYLLHHRLPPTRVVLSLGERGQLIGAHHVQFFSHLCTWCEPGCREDVAHAAEAKRCVIVVVGIQVLIIDVVVHLRVLAPSGSGDSSIYTSSAPSAIGAASPMVVYSTVKTSSPLPGLPSSPPEAQSHWTCSSKTTSRVT
jgi:hypothetical protein